MLDCMWILCLLLSSVYAYDTAFEFGSPQARRICQDLRASYNEPPGSDYHGDPQGTDPNLFANFTITRQSDNLWNITLTMVDGIEDSLAGWAIQVRPYGVGDLYTTAPIGVIESTETVSDYWHCPDASGVDNHTRNGIVHANGNANKLVDLRSISFTWASIPTLYPECARVVATVMSSNDLWYHIFESECFMSVNEAGEIDRCEYPKCDSRDPGEPPART